MDQADSSLYGLLPQGLKKPVVYHSLVPESDSSFRRARYAHALDTLRMVAEARLVEHLGLITFS